MKLLTISAFLLLLFLFDTGLCQTISQGNIANAYNESSNEVYSVEWVVCEILTNRLLQVTIM
jgi:hypothetical protein